MAGMLYLVPTPIGNLGDISLRCRETLESADFIAAEDTRVTLKLLNHLGIKKSLVSYYEHNKATTGSLTAFSPGRPARWSPTRAVPPSPTPGRTWSSSALKPASSFAPSPVPAPPSRR